MPLDLALWATDNVINLIFLLLTVNKQGSQNHRTVWVGIKHWKSRQRGMGCATTTGGSCSLNWLKSKGCGLDEDNGYYLSPTLQHNCNNSSLFTFSLRLGLEKSLWLWALTLAGAGGQGPVVGTAQTKQNCTRGWGAKAGLFQGKEVGETATGCN